MAIETSLSNLKIIDSGIAVASTPGTDRQSLVSPGICVLEGGRWLATWRAAETKGATFGRIFVSVSDDEGKSWSTPDSPFVPPAIEEKGIERPGVFRFGFATALEGRHAVIALGWVDYSDPQLPYFNAETEGLLDTRIFLSHSYDEGDSWSVPELMDTAPISDATPLTGSILKLANGEWACQFELNKHYYDTTQWRHSSILMFSNDAGKSWPSYTTSSNDPDNKIYYWDQRPGVLADGSVLDLFWTYDNVAGVYLNIHSRFSRDNARTWSQLQDTNVPGQPAPPVSLPNGDIAMVYVDRTVAPSIKVRVSDDGGLSWPDSSEITLYEAAIPSQIQEKNSMQDAWQELGKYSVGLPTTAALANDDILAFFYAGDHTDTTDIRWVRLRQA